MIKDYSKNCITKKNLYFLLKNFCIIFIFLYFVFLKFLFNFCFNEVLLSNSNNGFICISDISLRSENTLFREERFFNKIFLSILEKERIVKGSVFFEGISDLIKKKFKNKLAFFGRVNSVILVDLFDNLNFTKSLQITYLLSGYCYVKKINISGIKHFNDDYIRNSVLPITEKSITTILTESSVFFGKMRTVRNVKSSFEKFFFSHGFLDVKVIVNIIYEKDNDVVININVVENSLYVFKDVIFLFNNDGSLSDEKLLKSILTILNYYIVVGECYSFELLTECQKHITNFLMGCGYSDVNVTFNRIRKFDGDKVFVTVMFNIIKNKKFFVSKIIIFGNDFTQDYILRQFIIQNELDILNYFDILDSKDLLLSKGYVSTVDIKIIKDKTRENFVNVFFFIKESKQHFVFFDFDYFFENKNALSINYMVTKNFLGTGKRLFCFFEKQNKFVHYIFDYKSLIFDNSNFRFGVRFESARFINLKTTFYDKFLILLSNYSYPKTFSFYDNNDLFCFYSYYNILKKYRFKFEVFFIIYYSVEKLLFSDKNHHVVGCWDILTRVSFVYKLIHKNFTMQFPEYGILHIISFETTPILTYPIKFYKLGCDFDWYNTLGDNVVFKYTFKFCFFDIFMNKGYGGSIFLQHFSPLFHSYNSGMFAVRGFLQNCSGGYRCILKEGKKIDIFVGNNLMFYCQFSFFLNFKYLKSIHNFLKTGFFFDAGCLINTLYEKPFLKLNNELVPRFGYGLVFIFRLTKDFVSPPLMVSLGFPLNSKEENLESFFSIDYNKFNSNIF